MEAPKLPSFFKQNQHKRFEYTPRYYDERKERIEEMRKKYDDQNAGENYSSQKLRAKLSSEWRKNSSGKGGRGVNFRLVVIVMALFLISYLILFN